MTLFSGSLTDVQGLKVGHHTDPRRPTGCTVVLCEQGVTCGVDVRGAAPGTRETDLLAPGNLVDKVHALLLAGGSAFGLDAAGGVMRWLDERGHGFTVGPARVPIVPAAVLFDLWLGDARIRPDAQAGFAACEAASDQPPAQGSIGAGAGATVGKLFGTAHAMKGGIGSASLEVSGVRIAALVAVNAAGDVIDPATARVVAGSRQLDGQTPRRITAALARGLMPPTILAGAATTIGIVATDATLDKAQCSRLATMSHDGLARCIDPVHTASDGDTMFALATGGKQRTLPLTVLGALAAEVTQRAVLNGVRAATGVREPPLPSAQDLGWA
ncbi:MAG TPA: P1 family peptidase [Burkholderiaceae bacterium]